MSLQTVRSPFALSDYTPLSEHQEQTPDSFYDGKPVLHYHATGAKAWIPKAQRGKLPFFPADLSSAPTSPEGDALNGQTEETLEQKVDLFVNSRYEPFPAKPTSTQADADPLSLATSLFSAPQLSVASPSHTNKSVSTRSRPSVAAPATRPPIRPSTSSSSLPRVPGVTTNSTRLSSPSFRRILLPRPPMLPLLPATVRQRPLQNQKQAFFSRPSQNAPT